MFVHQSLCTYIHTYIVEQYSPERTRVRTAILQCSSKLRHLEDILGVEQNRMCHTHQHRVIEYLTSNDSPSQRELCHRDRHIAMKLKNEVLGHDAPHHLRTSVGLMMVKRCGWSVQVHREFCSIIISFVPPPCACAERCQYLRVICLQVNLPTFVCRSTCRH